MARLGLRELKRPNTRGASLSANSPKPISFPETPIIEQPAPDTSAELPRTNSGQSSDKLRTNLGINLGQSSDKPRTTANNGVAIDIESSDKLKTELRTEVRTNLGQSSDKPRTNGWFLGLFGLQRQILLFLYEQCKFARDKITNPITIAQLATSCETTAQSAQKTIQRLEKKSLLRRASYRDGRAGWTRYELSQETYQEILYLESQDKLRTNLGQTPDKHKTQPRTELRTSASSSSSSYVLEDFKITTTGEPELLENIPPQLSPEWEALDASPLAEVGFSQTHLIQIIRQGKLTSAEVQDSIQFFSFDLKRNGKGTTLNGSPLNFFMGILRKGIPYAPPENYESPADEARRKTREFKERKDRERQAEEQRILDLEFSEWRRGLTGGDLVQLLPEYARKPGPIQDSALKTHFEEEIWPTRCETIPGATPAEREQVQRQIEQSLQAGSTL